MIVIYNFFTIKNNVHFGLTQYTPLKKKRLFIFLLRYLLKDGHAEGIELEQLKQSVPLKGKTKRQTKYIFLKVFSKRFLFQVNNRKKKKETKNERREGREERKEGGREGSRKRERKEYREGKEGRKLDDQKNYLKFALNFFKIQFM